MKLLSIILFLLFFEMFGLSKDIDIKIDHNANATECHQLAQKYFHDKKCYRKALYWAEQGALLGSSDCMYLLRKSFGQGIGIVQDTTESLKWLFLASAIGNKNAQEEVHSLETIIFQMDCVDSKATIKSKTEWEEASKRASNWINENKRLFFNPE